MFDLKESSLYKSWTIDKTTNRRMNQGMLEKGQDEIPPVLHKHFERSIPIQRDVSEFLDLCSSSTYQNEIVRNVQHCKNIFERTTLQALSKLWFAERKLRISASQAHKVNFF